VFESLSRQSQGKGLHAGNGFIAVCAVSHDASQQRSFGQPTAVVFPFKFNRKRHAGTEHPGRLSNKALHPTSRATRWVIRGAIVLGSRVSASVIRHVRQVRASAMKRGKEG
jgi:hypothetical protein